MTRSEIVDMIKAELRHRNTERAYNDRDATWRDAIISVCEQFLDNIGDLTKEKDDER